MQEPRIPDILRETLAELGSIPRRGLIYLGIFGILVGAVDVLTWTHRPAYAAIDYVILAASMVAWVAVAYAISMAMVEKSSTLRGFARFSASSLALALIPIVGLVSLLFGTGTNQGGLIALGAAMTVTGLVLSTLLVGWPILVATSERFIGPVQALRMTKGFRWQLFFASLVVGGVSRGISDTSTTDDFGTAVLLAALNALVSTFVSMIALSIAVAAFKSMSARSASPADRPS